MARVIATIGGTALRPGVSKNRRWYKPEHVAGAVQRAQERIAAGDKPMVMLTFHGAEDSSREIAASLTGMRLAEDGSAEFEAGFADTPAGWDIAKLADTSDGKPAHLKNVSIRGFWTGKVRKERGPDGEMVETADGLEIEGVDWTKAPGVDGAEIKTFSWVSGGQNETTERVLITESVEATVTVTEETAPEVPQVPESAREAVRAVFAPAEVHILEDGLCATCGDVTEAKAKPDTRPYGDVPYADTGYLDADGKQASSSGKPGIKRYPLDKKHIRAAWSYINQAKNAAQYTAGQLKRIKGRIKSAMRSIGAKVSAESGIVGGFVIGEAVEATAGVLEWLGEDPKRSGSWSVSASNGPVNLNLSSYCMDPADLDVILRAAAAAACAALKTLDPDMDGDIDVPGAPGADTDHDGGHETAPEDDDPATETAPAAEAAGGNPAPAGTQERGDPAMAEGTTTTEAGGTAPAGLTLEAVQAASAQAAAAAVTAAFEARDKAKQDRKDAEAREAAEKAARKAELAETLKELGVELPAKPAATETAPEAGATPVDEAAVQKQIQDGITAGVTEAIQSLVSDGSIMVRRAGLVEHAAPTVDTAPTTKELNDMDDESFIDHLGAAQVEGATTAIPAR